MKDNTEDQCNVDWDIQIKATYAKFPSAKPVIYVC